MSAGTPGASKIWDFGELVADGGELQTFRHAAWTSHANEFPNSNMALELGNDQYVYFIHDNQGLFVDGVAQDFDGNGMVDYAHYDDPLQAAKFPISMGNNFSDTATLNVFIPGDGTQFDSARFTQTTMVDVRIDAWGTIIIPMGAYEALRAEVDTRTITDITAYFLGAPIFTQSQDTTVRTYEWYSDHADIQGLAMRGNADTSGNIHSAEFNAAAPSVGIMETEAVSFTVYPNPASELITFHTEENVDAQLSIYSIEGKLMEGFNLVDGKLTVDLTAYPAGLYFYSIKTENAEIANGKFSVTK